MRPSKKIIIIDGFNVLRSSRRYRALMGDEADYTHDAYNAMREALINDVGHFIEPHEHAIIVFDGMSNLYSTGESTRKGNIEVIFSPTHYSADNIIERLAYEHREAHHEVRVVSSDLAIQDTVFADTVTRVSVNEFCNEIESNMSDVQAEEANLPHSKNTVAKRIDAGTLERLKHLRDSL